MNKSPRQEKTANSLTVAIRFSESEAKLTMVVKEAMACNLPVVSTRVGDVPEVIGGVEGCHLVEPDAREIADRLLQVIRWGKRTNGREHIQYLKSDLITQQVIDVYNELCPPERRFTEPVVL